MCNEIPSLSKAMSFAVGLKFSWGRTLLILTFVLHEDFVRRATKALILKLWEITSRAHVERSQFIQFLAKLQFLGNYT